MNARVRQSGTMHGAAAVQQQRMPVAGKIRPGIKVPTNKASAIPEVKEAYEQGIDVGASYADIEKAMKAAHEKCPAYPMAPRNAPYFRVHQSDFSIPNAAKQLIDLYGEQRDGDPEPRLYSFPVVFPSDDIDLVFREQFEAWNASQLMHWSETDPQTGELVCMRRQEVKPDRNRRRQWGGRPTEAVGPCQPNSCDLFADGKCQHMGSLYFWVPGIQGVGVIELEFRSIYASMGIMEVLELVKTGLGRIKGTIGGKPLFWISKSQQDVSVMDWQSGKPKRQAQQIIRLEASGLDMTQVLAAQEAPMLAAPERPESLRLEGPTRQPTQPEEDFDRETGEVLTGEVEPAANEPPADDLKALRGELSAEAKRLEWSPQDLADWIRKHWSEDDAHDPAKVKEMIEKIKEIPF